MQTTDLALNNVINSLGKKVKTRSKNTEVQLPAWGEDKRGTPNSFLRSSLFAAIQGKDRYFTKGEILYAQKGITVKYTGERLNQDDLTLWETLVDAAKESPLGDECGFTGYSILKAMDLKIGGDQYERLHEGIIRLTGGVIEITHEGKTYIGTMIEGGQKDEHSRVYYLRLNRDLIRLYGDTQYTAIDWKQRLALQRKPLAQFLHGYYSSHREPFPLKLETLYGLTGSQNGKMKGFKQKVKTALEALVAIGFLESYQIDGDIVSVKRNNKASLQG